MLSHLRPTPGSKNYIRAIVVAQMLAQIGAFALPALLPGYIDRWALSKTEAGWLIGIFFAAYVMMVPVLVALTDRVPVRRVYLLGTGLTAISHIGFALIAAGFWSGFLLRVLAGIGWAGTYMPGLKAIADPLEGTAQSRAVSWHAAGVGVSGAASFAVAGAIGNWAGPRRHFSSAARARWLPYAGRFCYAARCWQDRRRRSPAPASRLPPGLAQPGGDGLDRRLRSTHLGTGSVAGVGRDVSRSRLRAPGRAVWLPDPTLLFTAAGLAGIAVSITGNETAQRWGRSRVVTVAMSTAAGLSLLAGWSVGFPAPVAA